MKSPTIGLLSSRGQKHRSGSPGKALSAAKRRPAPGSLSPDELLAKIDALDWDQTISPDTVVAGAAAVATREPETSSAAWRWAAIAGGLLFLAVAIYLLLVPETPTRPAAEPSRSPIGAPSEPESKAAQLPAPEESLAAVAAAEERRAALYAQAVRQAELADQRKADQQRQVREARAAERAKLAEQKERERFQHEEAARLRAERDAEEAARAAKAREQAAAAVPASPQEYCAGAGNIFARGVCEASACGRAEWRNHPYCVKRLEQQLPGFGPGG